jgi:hypothetical protein
MVLQQTIIIGGHAVAARRLSPAYCMNPQIESNAAMTRPIHESDIGTEYGPMFTVQPLNILMRWAIATTAKTSADTAA